MSFKLQPCFYPFTKSLDLGKDPHLVTTDAPLLRVSPVIKTKGPGPLLLAVSLSVNQKQRLDPEIMEEGRWREAAGRMEVTQD